MIRPLQFIRRRWRTSLSRRVLLSQITVSLCFLLLFGWLAVGISQKAIRHEVNQRNDQLAMLVAQDIRTEFDGIWNNIRLFTSQLHAAPEKLPLQAQAMLDFRRVSPLTYRALYLFDPQGRLLIHLADPLDELQKITSGEQLLGRPPAPRILQVDVALQAALSGIHYLSPVTITGADRVPVVYAALRIAPDQRSNSQIMVAEIDLRSIWRRVDEISIGRSGHAYVISPDGVIIAHPRRERIGQPVDAALHQVLAGYQGHTTYQDALNGQVLLASYSPVSGATGWGVIVEQEQMEVFAPIGEIFYATAGLLLLAILLSTLMTALLSQSIVRPVQDLARITQNIARTQDLRQDVPIEGEDEVAQLAQAFNEMIASLRISQTALQEYSEKLEETVKLRTAELVKTQNQMSRHANELEFAIQQLESFSYSVSHDLRSPLRAIDGYAQIMLNEYNAHLPDEARLLLQKIRSNAQQMGLLINNLVDFARLGRKQLEIRPVELNLLVQQIMQKLLEQNTERRIEVSIANLPVWQADEAMLQEAFTQLLSNAIKFTRTRPTAHIEVGHLLEDGQTICYVKDNGVGFDMHYANKLFRVFHQLHPKHEYEGVGIGLAIVQRIIQRHGGRVWAESIPGQGATFYLTLDGD